MLFVPLVLHLVWLATNARFWVWAVVVGLNFALALASIRRGIPERVGIAPPHSTARRASALLTLYVAACVFCFYWIPVARGRIAWSPSGD